MDRSQTILQIAKKSLHKAVMDGEEWLPNNLEDWLLEKRGVFSTLYDNSAGPHKLRGCVGLPYPTEKLGHAIAISTKRSALEDPRFNPVKPKELPNLFITVEILSPMKKLLWKELRDLMDQIELGIHGLMLKYNDFGGILLPKVPIIHNMTKEEFMIALCRKAFLPKSALKQAEFELFSFTSEYFSETKIMM